MNFLASTEFTNYWNSPEVATNFIVLLNLLGALLLGLMVGYERSYRGRAAGMRTYGLVCMSAAALTVISGYPHMWFGGHTEGMGNIDPTRTIQGVVTGIGFLGAGIIMKDGMNISGLTTAASIWTAAAIGILVGVGFYLAAIALTLLSGSFMMWGAKIENMLPTRHAILITLHFRKDYVPNEEALRQVVLGHGYEIAKGSFAIQQHNGRPEWRFVAISLGRSQGASLGELSRVLPQIDGIESFQLSHARN